MWLLWETGAMSVVLPELAAYLDDEEGTGGGARRFYRRMDAIDAMTRARGKALDDIVLWTLLLKEPLDEACAGESDKARAVAEFLEPIVERVAVPRRISDGVRRIVAMLPRLMAGRAGRMGRTELMGPAVDVLEAELIASDRSTALAEKLREGLPPAPPRGYSSRGPTHRDLRPHRERRP
jgi:poly(A) polymerase